MQVRYADGHTEQVRNGIYQRTDRRGRVVEQHRAARNEINRLSALRTGGQQARQGLDSVILISTSGQSAQVIDRNGWSEEIGGGVYQLTDPNGNLVTRRRATADDLGRIGAMVAAR